MTKEKKQILLKDLCNRLPYGVLLNVTSRYANKQQNAYTMVGIVESDVLIEIEYEPSMGMMDARPLHIPIKDVKPYLRPLTSMIEKEYETFPIPFSFDSFSTWNNTILSKVIEGSQILIGIDEITEIIDWLNAHHFDYRGLIGMGLALEASEDMYN